MMRKRGNRLRPVALAAAGALALVAVGSLPGGEREAGAFHKPAKQPNVVLVMTDDQAPQTVNPTVMPNLFELLAPRGSFFTDYIVTTPLCCPSRATTITGQYGHNNGVLRNVYADLINKKNTLPVWLQRAGYTTAHLGKYLNGYENFARKGADVAPGWDLWFTQLAKRRFYDWRASKNGKRVNFGSRDRDHLTDVTSRKAARWTRRMARKPDPFYIQVDYYAPHTAQGRDDYCKAAPVPGPREEGAFADLPLPRPPSFNEADVSDKPSFIADRARMTQEEIDRSTRHYRCVAESMLGVDRGIKKIYRTVERAGELDETVFVFTTDNGFFFGEHRIPKGKQFPYDETLKLPLLISVPKAYRDGAEVIGEIDAPVANIDLAPTILQLAGADPCKREGVCRTMDGRSLMPLLRGRGAGFPDPRAFVIELSDCTYRGIRRDQNIYLEHGDSSTPISGGCRPTEIEHYDVEDDPYQLENLFPAPRRSADGKLQRELEGRMAELLSCAGVAGRDPLPPSGVHCE